MRAIGCVRQIDKLGRLVLPSDIRKSLNIVNGVDSVEFFVDDDAVIIPAGGAAYYIPTQTVTWTVTL